MYDLHLAKLQAGLVAWRAGRGGDCPRALDKLPPLDFIGV